MINVIIPARKGSKGFPGKNRILLQDTLKTLPKNNKSDEINNGTCNPDYRYILTTDDEYFFDNAQDYEDKNNISIELIKRESRLSNDTANIKDVLINTIAKANIKEDDLIVMLYLPYPERTWGEIQEALYLYYNLDKPDSLLCKTNPKSHPWMCLEADGDNGGSQLVRHNLYRRQDYPECFEISHYIFIAEARMIKHLNNNLYNDNTKYMQIANKIDIDTKFDYDKFMDVVK